MKHLLPLALLLSGCAITKLMSTSRSHADHDGELRAQVSAPVQVIRDDLGIPHIRAHTEADAAYALGLVHAQDRLFQADLVRRYAFGTLSEVLGARTVQVDRMMGSLDLASRAEALIPDDPELLAWLDAYVAGMNAGAASMAVPPIEYRLLNQEFEPWTRVDCFSSAFAQSWDLQSNASFELLALALADLDVDTLDALLRIDAEAPPMDPYWDTLRAATLGSYRAPFLTLTGRVTRGENAAASNNWVVGPERSADGSPIVANDPHLLQRVPSLWYMADIQGGGLHVAGATLPGTPFVVIGHNESIAWGLTNVMADYVDMAIVQRDGEDGYILAGETRKLEKRPLTVDVAENDPIEDAAMWTEIGPVATEIDGTHLLVARWHALEVADETGIAFYALNRARTVSEALDAVDRPSMVAQNLVVADVNGDYAWQQFGSIPKRKAHTGRVPYPASDPAHGWDGWIEDLPGERQPARGYALSANSRPPGFDEITHDISTSYVAPWRYDRIDELLHHGGDFTAADMERIQGDVYDARLAEVLPRLLEGVEPTTADARRCHDILTSWHGYAFSDQQGPAAAMVFQRELVRQALVDELGNDGVALYLRFVAAGRSILDGELDRFLDDRPKAADRALAAACSTLDEAYSSEDWQWGQVHRLELNHPFAAGIGILSGWNMRSVPFPGSNDTIAAAGHGWSGTSAPVGGMASLRIVMPLSDLGKSTLVHPGGQSGQPGHPMYRTHYEAFVAGETQPLWFDDDDVAAHTVHTLVLTPSGA